MRRNLLIYIGDKGAVRFVELKREFKMSTGALYYHLGMLRGLIAQKEDKSYTLTEEGVKIYKKLSASKKGEKTMSILSGMLLLPIDRALSLDMYKLVLEATMLGVLLISLSLFDKPLIGVYPYRYVGGSWLLNIANIFMIWIFVEGISYFFVGKYGHLKLFVGLELCYLLYSLIIIFTWTVNPSIVGYVMIAAQGWLILLIARLLNLIKEIPLDVGIAIGLAFIYINAAFLYALS